MKHLTDSFLRPLAVRALLLSLCLFGLGLVTLDGQQHLRSLSNDESPLEMEQPENGEPEEILEPFQPPSSTETPEERVERLRQELKAAELAAQIAQEAREAEETRELKATELVVPTGALVVVSSGSSEGSGFIAEIRGRIFFVTNIHVLGAAKDARFSTIDGVPVPLGSVAFLSVTRDLAIVPIEWDGPALPVSRSLTSDNVTIGQQVLVMGNTSGARVATRLSGAIRGVGPDEIEISAKFEPGNSGSPIFHEELGTVIGVVSHMRDMRAKSKWTQDSQMADIRRFGFRLDGDIEWQQFTLEELFRQAAQFGRFEERTYIIAHISHMLQVESALVTGYSSHDSLGYLFSPFERNFNWNRGTASANNIRLMKQFIDRLQSELLTDRVSTDRALTINFYKTRFKELETYREQLSSELRRYAATRL
jgi:S1-C subfamily serine protease